MDKVPAATQPQSNVMLRVRDREYRHAMQARCRLGCVKSSSAARGSQEAGFTQPNLCRLSHAYTDTIRQIVSLADVDAVREERESYSILRCAEIVLANIDESSGL